MEGVVYAIGMFHARQRLVERLKQAQSRDAVSKLLAHGEALSGYEQT
jgi:hypothetical protein